MNFQLKKRLFDLTIAIPSVIILSPLLVFIGFLVRLKIGSPVFFRQVRPGLHVHYNQQDIVFYGCIN